MKISIVILLIGFLGFLQLAFANTARVPLPHKAKTYKTLNLSDDDDPKKHDVKSIIAVVIIVLGFGYLGLHRVAMGGSWWLVLFYLITFGGFFGILPFMDTIRILLEPEHYRNNNHFFAAFGFM